VVCLAKFLVVSCLGETVGLAIRLLAEGHEVLYYIHDENEADCGDGFLNKVDDWRKHIEEADIIFFDDVDQKHEGDSAYKSSAWSQEVRSAYPDKPIIGGGSPDVAKLENDRIFGQEVMEQVGIPTVPMEQFTSFQDAIKFVEENQGAWALKHNSQVDRDLAHVSDDPQDMVEFLQYLDENWADLGNGQPIDFVLQQKVDGVEFAVTCFFDGQHFRKEACYLNQEEKKLMDGGLGPATGQMGEIGLIVPNARFYQETLAKLEQFLQDKQYVGFVDVNCIVNEHQIVPLEFTSGRPGYPTLYSWCEMLKEPVGDWLLRMAKHDEAPIQTHEGFNCTLVLTTGSFPDQHPTRNKLAVIKGLNKTGLRHVWLGEVRWHEGKVMGAGILGYTAVITCKGADILSAREGAYDIIEQIKVVPYAKYRLDIGAKALQEFWQLQRWGWLN
jgi:phosphoribosylamine--glycine ligase